MASTISLSPPSLRHAISPPPGLSPSGSRIQPSISPAKKDPNPNRLLIPTDRSLEELEEKWLPRLGRLRVDQEVVLYGYALYALRTWCVLDVVLSKVWS